MPFKTILTGALLIGVSFLIRFAADAAGFAPWLPAVFGAVFVVLGLAAMKGDLRRHAIHLAAVVALIMVALTLVRVITSGTSGWEAVRQIAMIVIGGGFLATAVGSFRQARTERKSVEVAN